MCSIFLHNGLRLFQRAALDCAADLNRPSVVTCFPLQCELETQLISKSTAKNHLVMGRTIHSKSTSINGFQKYITRNKHPSMDFKSISPSSSLNMRPRPSTVKTLSVGMNLFHRRRAKKVRRRSSFGGLQKSSELLIDLSNYGLSFHDFRFCERAFARHCSRTLSIVYGGQLSVLNIG